MQKNRTGAPAHKAIRAIALIAGLGTTAGMQGAWAQPAPSEAVQRQASSPYRFILQNANAPTRKPAPAPPAAPVEAKRPPAPEPTQTAIARPAPAPVAPAPVALPAPIAASPEPAPTVAAIPPRPDPVVEKVVHRDIVPLHTDEPKLPMQLLRERPNGVVKVHFDLNPDGSTGNVKVVSSTNRALNKVSVEAVSGWKFQPVDEVLSIETELAYKYE
jgi:TonB family protein